MQYGIIGWIQAKLRTKSSHLGRWHTFLDNINDT